MFGISAIFWSFVVSIFSASSLFIFLVGSSIVSFVFSKFQKYSQGKWIIAILAAVVIFSGLIVVEQYQAEVLTVVDQVYECGIEKASELGFAIANYVLKQPINFAFPRWNDAVLTARECVKTFIDVFDVLPPLTNVGFYTEITRSLFNVYECLTLVPFETPSWELPFGASDFLSSFARFQLCIWRILVQVTTRFIDYTLIRNDCEFCELDPNANCFLRQPPFFAPSNYPPTLSPTCTGCLSIDCEMIRCVMGALSNFTAPIDPILPIELGPFFEEFATHICCIVEKTYKPPFWLLQGLIDGCIDITDALDFITDQWLTPWANCWIDLVSFISGGVVTDFFLYVFSILFPFIQVVIDSYNQLVDCAGLTAPCWNNLFNVYDNGQCIFDGSALLVTNAGRVCANTFGSCVVLGSGSIEPNTIFSFPPFNFFFLTAFPNLWIPIDAVLCTVEPIFYCATDPTTDPGRPPPTPVCFTGFSPSDLFGPLTCSLECFEQEVDLMSPFFGAIAVFVDIFGDIFQDLIGVINDIIDSLNQACSIIATLTGGSTCPSIPNILMSQDIRENVTFTDWDTFLNYHKIENGTTCGNILHDARNHVIDVKSDPGFYLMFWPCYAIAMTAYKNNAMFPNVSINRALDLSTMVDEFGNILACKVAQNATDMNARLMAKQRVERAKDYLVEDMWKFDNSHQRRETRKYLTLYSGGQNISEMTGTTNNAVVAIWEKFTESEYYDYAASFLAIHKALRTRDLTWINQKYVPEYQTQHVVPGHNDSTYIELQGKIDGEIKRSRGEMSSYELELADIKFDYVIREKYAEAVTVLINKIQSTVDHSYALRLEKNKMRTRNIGLASSSKKSSRSIAKREKIHITVQDLIQKKKEAEKFHKAVARAYSSLKNVADVVNPDGRLIPTILKAAGLEHWEMYRGAHALYNVKNQEDLHNLTQYHLGELKYVVGTGYVSHEQYEKIEKERQQELTILSMLEGTYNPRRQRTYGFAGSDPDTKWIDFKSMINSVKPITRERKIKAMIERGIDLESEEAKNFKVSFINGITNNPVIELFENVVAFISRIIQVFGGPKFSLDLSDLIGGFIDSIDPQEIAESSVETTFDLINRIFSCSIPADFDGTNDYKAACFFLGFLPEGIFSWIVPVGRGNAFFPYQLQYPAGILKQGCVNQYNGNPNLREFAFSNNCPIMDGMPRPLCDAQVQCDWCQKEFNTCADIGLDGPFNTLFFLIGYIPVLLQNFFTGVISSSTVTMLFMFVFMYIFSVGGLQMVFGFPFTITIAVLVTLAQYLIVNIFNEVFAGLAEPGSEGGIPFGLIFVLLYLLIVTFGSSLFESLPSFLGVTVGGSLSFLWFINLIVPFRSVRSDLKLVVWIAEFLKVVRDAPTPLAFIPGLDNVISIALQYDYSTMDVPGADIFCFFFTGSNLVLLAAAAIILSDVFEFLGTILLWPLFYFVSAIIAAILSMYVNIRQWVVRQRVSDSEDRLDEIEKAIKQSNKTNYRKIKKMKQD